MRPVSYSNYYNEGGNDMRVGGEDLFLRQVKFESYAELNQWLKDENLYPGVNTRYEGTQTCGDIRVSFSVNKIAERERVLKKMGELIKFL